MTTEPHPPIADTAPTDPLLTDYDRSHFVTYLRLIDAASANAPWDEVARIVLGLDPTAKPEAARRTHESHLARAKWLCDHGYRDLLRRVS